jgi:penicillin-binding protein 2
MLSNDTIQNHLITRRAFMLATGQCAALGILAGRVLYMQAIKAGEYKTLSDQNRINIVMLNPARGNIIDSHGNVIAGNRALFKIMLDKHSSKDYKSSLDNLFKILDLDQKQQDAVREKIRKYGLQSPLEIISDITWQQLAQVEENTLDLSGIYVEMGECRTYSYSQALSHVIGYTGILNKAEKQELALHNLGSFNVGKTGVEKFYESYLRGTFGVKKMEVNAYGIHVRTISQKASIPGDMLQINIDAELQCSVYKLLPSTGGAAVVMDVDNGRLLACVSSKGFDPNKFTGGVSHEYWNELNSDPYKPLINRFANATFPPGSLFKLITVSAALASGIDPNMKVYCAGGSSALGSHYFRCWYKSGHGELDMNGALQHSCNAYMYQIAKMIGCEKILDLARTFGFGVPTGVDLPSEAAGFVPSKTWKARKFKSDWTLADSLNISIGQGALLSTPLQLVRFCGIIASEGRACIPRIVGHDSSTTVDVDPRHLQILKKSMWDVVNTDGGTAYARRIMDSMWTMSGKTGTSQVQSKRGNIDLSTNAVPFFGRNHALFIGYIPSDAPKYAISVVIDHGGGGGSVAAPIARAIALELRKRYSVVTP